MTTLVPMISAGVVGMLVGMFVAYLDVWRQRNE